MICILEGRKFSSRICVRLLGACEKGYWCCCCKDRGCGDSSDGGVVVEFSQDWRIFRNLLLRKFQPHAIRSCFKELIRKLFPNILLISTSMLPVGVSVTDAVVSQATNISINVFILFVWINWKLKIKSTTTVTFLLLKRNEYYLVSQNFSLLIFWPLALSFISFCWG